MAAWRASANPVCLVVDDEPFIRMDAADMARHAGYDVIEAQTLMKQSASLKVGTISR